MGVDVGLWKSIPVTWWRFLAAGGASFSLVLMILFLDLTKLLPIAADLLVLAAVFTDWLPLPTGVPR